MLRGRGKGQITESNKVQHMYHMENDHVMEFAEYGRTARAAEEN